MPYPHPLIFNPAVHGSPLAKLANIAAPSMMAQAVLTALLFPIFLPVLHGPLVSSGPPLFWLAPLLLPSLLLLFRTSTYLRALRAFFRGCFSWGDLPPPTVAQTPPVLVTVASAELPEDLSHHLPSNASAFRHLPPRRSRLLERPTSLFVCLSSDLLEPDAARGAEAHGTPGPPAGSTEGVSNASGAV